MAARYKIFDNVKLLNRLSYLIAIISIFILIFSSLYYLIQNKFRVDRIYISGDLKHVTYNQLMYVAKNRLHGTFFTLNIDELRDQFRQIPWVKDVVVRRDFPSTINVDLTEYDVIARLGKNALVSQNGEIFSGAENQLDLPTFYANDDRVKSLVDNYNVLQPFMKAHNLMLLDINGNNNNVTQVHFTNGLKLVVCGSDFAQKIHFLDTNWEKINQINPNLNSVNMCYKNAVAINRVNIIESKKNGK